MSSDEPRIDRTIEIRVRKAHIQDKAVFRVALRTLLPDFQPNEAKPINLSPVRVIADPKDPLYCFVHVRAWT
jgi:hypothetical protein